MNTQNLFLTLGLVALIGSTSSNSGCNSESNNTCVIPTSFASYQQAEELIFSQEYQTEELLETPESSFIKNAAYYSCDNIAGALQIGLNDNIYFYTGVPKFVWEGLKTSDSKGSYYNTKIKGKYVHVKY